MKCERCDNKISDDWTFVRDLGHYEVFKLPTLVPGARVFCSEKCWTEAREDEHKKKQERH